MPPPGFLYPVGVFDPRNDGQVEDEELKNFRRQWRKADKDGSETLDRKEVVVLVQKVNIAGVVQAARADRPLVRSASGVCVPAGCIT